MVLDINRRSDKELVRTRKIIFFRIEDFFFKFSFKFLLMANKESYGHQLGEVAYRSWEGKNKFRDQLCSFLLGGSIHPQQPEPRIESFSPLTTIIFRGTGSSWAVQQKDRSLLAMLIENNFVVIYILTTNLHYVAEELFVWLWHLVEIFHNFWSPLCEYSQSVSHHVQTEK